MSDIMLHGVLLMPPELWDDSPIGVSQRHARYVEASEMIKRLRAELVECQKDAQRYRWLRGEATETSERWMRWTLQRWDGRSWNSLERAALDAAIDAALKEANACEDEIREAAKEIGATSAPPQSPEPHRHSP